MNDRQRMPVLRLMLDTVKMFSDIEYKEAVYRGDVEAAIKRLEKLAYRAAASNEDEKFYAENSITAVEAMLRLYQ